MVRQQALNIVLHQGVQPADEGGDHPQHQQHHAPPQRRNAAGQRDRQDAVQTDLHHYRRKQRGSRSAGASVGLRRPAVQRNDPGQQRKADQARQPQQRVLRRRHRQPGNLPQFKGAVGRPDQPAAPRHQQRTEASQRKPQLAGLRAAGKKRGAKGHNLRHHHQRAEVRHHHGADGGGQQEIHQQTVGFNLRMTMPGDIEQRNRQRRQADCQQPQRIDAANAQGQVQHLQHAGADAIRHQQRRSARQHQHRAGDRAANPGDRPAQRFAQGEQKRQHRAGGVPGHRLIH